MLSLGLMGMILFMSAGCERFYFKTVNIRIEAVDIVSISEEKPAEVLFVVGGVMGDGGDPSIQKVHAQRVGNTIFLKATGLKERFDSGRYAHYTIPQSTTDTIVVKTLEVGEYKVARHDGFELLQFRIEKGAAYVGQKAGIGDITVEMKTSEGIVMDTLKYPYRASYVVRKAGTEDREVVPYPFVVRKAGIEGIAVEYPIVYVAGPVQVSIGIEASLTREAGEYSEKVMVDEKSSDIIHIEIFGEAPINADGIEYKQLDAQRLHDIATELVFSPSYPRFEYKIPIGTFENGDYRVNINGSDEVGFSKRRFGAK